MGSPPEDDPGAGEGAPVRADDPGASAEQRKSALAARIDAYNFDDEADDEAGGAADDGAVDVNLDSQPVPKIEPSAIEPTAIEPSAIEAGVVDAEIEPLDDISVTVLPSGPTAATAMPTPPATVTPPRPVIKPPAIPPMRPGAAPPPLPKIPTGKLPPIRPPAIPPARTTGTLVVPPLSGQRTRTVTAQVPTPSRTRTNESGPSMRPRTPSPAPERMRAPSTTPPRSEPGGPSSPTSTPPTRPTPSELRGPSSPTSTPASRSDAPANGERTRAPSTPPAAAAETQSRLSVDDVLSGGAELGPVDGGIETGTATPNVVVDQPLETHLESPTVVERAIAALGETGADARAHALSDELEAKVLTDPTGAATLAYELGELAERRLADEARAVKAYNRALGLDPSLRANLWAIRRVFYRRQLWPNLGKLVDAEVQYARDDHERADLLVEKARIANHRLDEPDEARAALDEATRIAPQHQSALLELERVLAKGSETPALLDLWERLAETVEQPARKIAYLVEVARTAGATGDLARANEAFDKAAALAASSGNTNVAERVARERLRVAEERGTSQDATAAIDALATVLLHAFGPAGPGDAAPTPAGERPSRASALRLELVALRRRQAQLARKDGTADRAWDYLQQALALSPGEPILLADLTELAEELGRYDDLAELVQSWQSVEGDPARALNLSIRRADALLRGGQADQARALLASLEANAPGFVVLTSIGERDALARVDLAALAATYQSAATAALLGTWLGPGQPSRPDPNAAAALYVQAAELLAYDVATPDALEEARAALGKALEAVADHAAAREALTELDDLTGRVGEALARLDAAAAGATDTDAKRAAIERAIRLARSHGDLEAVLARQRALVELVPADIGARWRLEATLSQLGRDDERAELLSQIAADETDATGRGTALLAAARLRERSGAVELATDLYRQVLALWPEDGFARESLLDLLRAQERWQDLVTERRAEAKTLPDGPAARRALREAAWVLEVRLGDTANAAQVYEEWLVRFPDDRAALEGVARCRAAFGDRNGEVTARAALAEAEATPDAQWLHARALERAGQFDDAAELYRNLISSEEASVASTAAALGLGDIAAGRGDTVMRVEATAALAGRTSDPRLGAALAEDSGWMYALVLEDFERAAQSFEAAISLDPSRRGAHLGAALIAARRADPVQLAHAYEGLASVVEMPDAAAAMLLRGAAIAAAANEIELANSRIEAARNAAPDDTSALLVSAETAPAISITSEDAFAAIDPLLARAEVLEMRSTLTDDAASGASWELDRAEALELAGRLREAGAVVASVLKGRPDDLRALTALRRMANRVNDKATAASAAYQLSRVLGDRQARLELLREAVAVFDGPGLPHNTEYAIASLRRILAIEPGAPEFDRYLELLRERADAAALIRAITERINFNESDGTDAAPTISLLLERATVVHGTGDTESAMADLDVLLERLPTHVEALRFRADLAFNAGSVDDAVALWRRYLAAETRAGRRGEIELQLAQVLAENSNDLVGAIESLERVLESTPDDAALRERLLGLCLRANDWDRAVRELRALARMRPTPQDKAREELRLGLLLRDRLDDRAGARATLERARTLDPLNLDVVRELAELSEPPARAAMLALTAESFRDAIAQAPNRAALYEKLAQVNAWQADVDARWLALVAVEALGTPAPDHRQVLLQARQNLVAPTRVRLDDASRKALRGDLGGPLHELWKSIAPAVQTATGVDIAKLGFGRGDKIALKKLTDKYEPLATALACFGIDDADVYINAGRTGFARALAAETPVLCLGADIAAAASAHERFVLGRAVATLAEGVAGVADLRDGELAWTIAAALRAVDAPVPAALQEIVAGEDTGIAERAKVLKKEFSRKAKAAVQQSAARGAELAAVDPFRRSALAIRQRAGLVWASDLAVALAILDVGKGGRDIADSPAALDLTAWSVSAGHLQLRDKLQLVLKGTR